MFVASREDGAPAFGLGRRASSFMSSSGYVPRRDQLLMVDRAARTLYKIVRAWQSDSRLPGFPADRGRFEALHALYDLERTLNPDRLAFTHHGRVNPTVRAWGESTETGYRWLRGLTDVIMKRNGLEDMAPARGFEPWLASRIGGRAIQMVSFDVDEIRAYRRAIRRLGFASEPRPDNSPGDARPALDRPDDRSGQDDATPAPGPPPLATLFGPTGNPWVNGKSKEPLRPERYRVIKALRDAGPAGLTGKQLREESRCSDAVNVLKSLAESDPDWAAVIILPGTGGRGYRIRHADADPPTTPHNAPQPEATEVHNAINAW